MCPFHLTRKRVTKYSPTLNSQVLPIQSTKSQQILRPTNSFSFQYPKASDMTLKGHLIFAGQGSSCTLSLLPFVSSFALIAIFIDLILHFSHRKPVLLSAAPEYVACCRTPSQCWRVLQVEMAKSFDVSYERVSRYPPQSWFHDELANYNDLIFDDCFPQNSNMCSSRVSRFLITCAATWRIYLMSF